MSLGAVIQAGLAVGDDPAARVLHQKEWGVNREAECLDLQDWLLDYCR